LIVLVSLLTNKLMLNLVVIKMPDKKDYRQMVSIIGLSVEDFCITPETTVIEAVELLLLKNNELVSRNNLLEMENKLLKKEFLKKTI
jgi:hypothetical protein